MKYCTQCRTRHSDAERFCTACGTKLELLASPETAIRLGPPTLPPSHTSPPPSSKSEQQLDQASAIKKYYYLDSENQALGPHTIEELADLEQKGMIAGTTLVASEGDQEWKPWQEIDRGGKRPSLDPKMPSNGTNCGESPQRLNALSMPRAQGSGTCSLCRRHIRMREIKRLYGHDVCRECENNFATRRQLACLFDSILGSILIAPVSYIVSVVVLLPIVPITKLIVSHTHALDDLGPGLFIALIWLIYASLWSWKDCFAGRSLGKLLTGVQVIDDRTGKPAGIVASFKRNLPLAIPGVPPYVAFQLHRGHRIGDGWANTKVIWTKYATNPVFAADNRRDEQLAPLPASSAWQADQAATRIPQTPARL